MAEKNNELESVRRLLILLALKLGATSQELGTALGIDSSGIRKIINVRKIKKVEFIR